jgi:hypothetical protein
MLLATPNFILETMHGKAMFYFFLFGGFSVCCLSALAWQAEVARVGMIFKVQLESCITLHKIWGKLRWVFPQR